MYEVRNYHYSRFNSDEVANGSQKLDAGADMIPFTRMAPSMKLDLLPKIRSRRV